MQIEFAESFFESLNRINSPWSKTKDFFRSIKNRITKPYTTVKPRYLDHNWTDRDRLLVHMMFEILSQFIEKECSPGCVEWYGQHPHTILVGMERKNVRDEMQDLYDWWHKTYIPYENGDLTPKYDGPDIDFFSTVNKLDSEKTEEEKKYFDHLDEINKLENKIEDELNSNLHRLLNIRRLMWT